MTVHAADASIHVDVDRVNVDKTKRRASLPEKVYFAVFGRAAAGADAVSAWPGVKLHVSIQKMMTSHILVSPTTMIRPISYHCKHRAASGQPN